MHQAPSRCKPSFQLNKSAGRLLAVNSLRMATIGGGVWAVLLNLYVIRLGYDARFVGILTGASQVAVVAASLGSGAIAQRFDMKRIVVISMAGLLLSSLLLPLAESMGAVSTWWIIVMRLLAGISTGVYFANYYPLLTATTPTETRRQVFGLDSALTPFGGFAGSLLGGWLPALFAALLGSTVGSAMPYRWALIVGALLYIPAMALTAGIDSPQADPNSSRAGTRVLPPGARGIIGAMAGVSILRLVGENAAKTFLNVYLDTVLHTSTGTIGVIAAAGQLLAAPAALMTPRLSRKKGLVATVTWGALGVAVGLVIMAVLPSAAGAAIGFLVVNAAGQIARPAYIIFIQEVLGAQWRQLMSGVTTAGANVGSAIASFGGGYLATATSYSAMFVAGALASAAGGIMFWGQFKRPRGAYVADSQEGEAL